MLNETKALFDRGFAIHWIKPKSKAPVNSGWTSGPRATWDELLKQYRPGMNVGVRLGRASKIKNGYLAVIDCDVKSGEQKHTFEMQQKLKSLFGGSWIDSAPIVLSGRGNGSRHIYVLTSSPCAPKRLAQSPVNVKVKMPSATKPSKKEQAELSAQDLAAGWRLRPAWEIAFMQEGQQVVLPPSTHPDTGGLYKWARTGEEPLVDLGAVLEGENGTQGRPGAPKTIVGEGFAPVEVDLLSSELSDRIYSLITDGKDCEDRSAALFSASLAMVKAGFSDNEILSVLTDPENYLGGAAYDHAKTNSRKRAAEWVQKYTLQKARKEADAAAAFDCEVEVSTLSPEELAAVNADAALVDDWKTQIERTSPQSGSKPKATFSNVFLILSNAVGQDVFKYNEFSGANLYGPRPLPWKEGAVLEHHAVRDIDLLQIKKWFADFYRIEPNTNMIAEAVATISYENKFHPVRDYLNALKWDGVPRISTWLKRHLNASAPEPYLSAVSRKVMVAMVARVMEPGRKFDQVLILEGGQGKGKSTAVRHLAGDKWFSDAHINIKDKDAVLSLQAHWIIELGELSGMRKADVDSLKEFISRTTDKIRVPYGKLPEDFPRQCVFIGTTNNDEFLKDETGNRRYWPVSVGEYDFKSILKERDQLFAEAKLEWELGEPLYLEDKSAAGIAVDEQKKRMESDTLIELLENKFTALEKLPVAERTFSPERFCMSELFHDMGPLAGVLKDDIAGQKRVAKALRMLGYEKKTARVEGGRLRKIWTKSGKRV